MKQFITKFLSLAVMILSASINVLSLNFTYEDINYSVIDAEARTCRTVKSSITFNDLEIPAVASDGKNEYTVTEIGEKSFEQWMDLHTVKLPNTITRIGKKAFYCCTSLWSINMPESLVEIADSAFFIEYEDYHHNNYISPKSKQSSKSGITLPEGLKRIGKAAFMESWLKLVNIPSYLTEIEDYAFYNNTPADMTMPPSLTKIGNYAFVECKASEIIIPNGVTSIGEYAFKCSSVERVILPSSLKTIADGLFKECKSLREVSIPDGVTAIGESAFCNTRLQSVNLPDALTCIGDSAFFQSSFASIEFPDGVTHIGKYAFSHCSNLTYVSLPPKLTEINKGLFESNYSLINASIPQSVTLIDDKAFFFCFKLKDMALPANLEYIGPFAFTQCDLAEILIPNSVKDIGEYAFTACSSLEKAVLPDSLTVIPKALFANCHNLKSVATSSSPAVDGEFTIPISTISIDSIAFKGCKFLTSFSIPKNVAEITGNPFSHCSNLESINLDVANTHFKIEDGVLFNFDGDRLISFPGTKGGHYDIPSTVSDIGESAFSGNENIQSISMPDCVTTIGGDAFSDCVNLKNVAFSKSLEKIGYSAFEKAPLRNIVLPPPLKILGMYAFGTSEPIESVKIYCVLDEGMYMFSHCENIESVYYLSPVVQDEYDNDRNIIWAFNNAITKVPLYVLAETYDEIKNGTFDPWSQFKDIRIYDPTDDPYLSSVEEINEDIDLNMPLRVYNLNGVQVGISTENLPHGMYILRQGSKTKKLMVNN